MNTAHCRLRIVHCELCIVNTADCTLHSALCTVRIEHCLRPENCGRLLGPVRCIHFLHTLSTCSFYIQFLHTVSTYCSAHSAAPSKGAPCKTGPDDNMLLAARNSHAQIATYWPAPICSEPARRSWSGPPTRKEKGCPLARYAQATLWGPVHVRAAAAWLC